MSFGESGTAASHDQDGTGGMSQETFRDAAEIEPLALGQIARPDHQEVGMIRLHLFDDGVNDVVHLHSVSTA